MDSGYSDTYIDRWIYRQINRQTDRQADDGWINLSIDRNERHAVSLCLDPASCQPSQ